MEHPSVKEICVLGLPDEKYGEEIAALVVLDGPDSLSHEQLKDFSRDKLSSYKVPRIWKTLDSIPRN